jgi:hypothetical protein
MDGLDEKIKQIADMLGIKNIPENAADIISSLTEKKDDTVNPPAVSSSIGQDRETRGTVDASITLLLAVKPFLNSSRRYKIDKCVKYLRASDILKAMNLFEK